MGGIKGARCYFKQKHVGHVIGLSPLVATWVVHLLLLQEGFHLGLLVSKGVLGSRGEMIFEEDLDDHITG